MEFQEEQIKEKEHIIEEYIERLRKFELEMQNNKSDPRKIRINNSEETISLKRQIEKLEKTYTDLQQQSNGNKNYVNKK